MHGSSVEKLLLHVGGAAPSPPNPPPTPLSPLFLSRTKRASKKVKRLICSKHRVSIVFANEGGCAPPPPNPLLFRPCRACFKAQKLEAREAARGRGIRGSCKGRFQGGLERGV